MGKHGVDGLSGPNTCSRCGGAGAYTKEVFSKIPFSPPKLERVSPCDLCGGSGTIEDEAPTATQDDEPKTPPETTGWETDVGWK